MKGLISSSEASVSMKALYRLWKKATAWLICAALSPSAKASLRACHAPKPTAGSMRLLEDGLGSLRRHFLNLHAAGLRGHEDQLAGRAVEHDAQIKLAIDGRGLLDQQPLHLLPLRAGLVRHQLHAQNVLGVQFGVFAVARHLHAAALAAPSGVNLRLDHDARSALGKQLAGHVEASSSVLATSPLGTATPYLRQDFFCLILVDLH